MGTMPSGCSVNIDPRVKKSQMYFNGIDTPSGIRAKPDSDGQPWVSPSGVGTGYHQNAPVCGVCTTTTTAAPNEPEVPEDDDAAAVGDPHLSSDSGETFDLEGGMLNNRH